MARLYTIQDIESALRYWSRIEPADQHALGPSTRVLADVYGTMIFWRQSDVSSDSLTEAQVTALATALSLDAAA